MMMRMMMMSRFEFMEKGEISSTDDLICLIRGCNFLWGSWCVARVALVVVDIPTSMIII